jgi:hypothetical protein
LSQGEDVGIALAVDNTPSTACYTAVAIFIPQNFPSQLQCFLDDFFSFCASISDFSLNQSKAELPWEGIAYEA